MNDSLYLEIIGGAVALAVVWLIVNDLCHGKRFRFDSLVNRQKPALTKKAVLIGFGWRAALNIILISIGMYQSLWILVVLGFASMAVQKFVLKRMLESAEPQTVVK